MAPMFGARTPVTSTLLVLIAAVFVLETVRGGSTNPQVLLALGADYPPLVQQGEYWRLVTSMFLHIGILHLVLNGWALYQLGGLFELLLGSGRLLVVYFVSGIVGSIASSSVRTSSCTTTSEGASSAASSNVALSRS